MPKEFRCKEPRPGVTKVQLEKFYYYSCFYNFFNIQTSTRARKKNPRRGRISRGIAMPVCQRYCAGLSEVAKSREKRSMKAKLCIHEEREVGRLLVENKQQQHRKLMKMQKTTLWKNDKTEIAQQLSAAKRRR